MSANYLKHGSYNVICDRCGFKYKAEETVKEWTGFRVCKKHCYEKRHPQDKIKNVKDNQTVPDPRPEQPDVFRGAADITVDDLYL